MRDCVHLIKALRFEQVDEILRLTDGDGGAGAVHEDVSHVV